MDSVDEAPERAANADGCFDLIFETLAGYKKSGEIIHRFQHTFLNV
jgi:hypothetical protein